MKLAAVITGTLMAACLVGTLIHPELAAAHVYHAWWFIGLIGLFCLNLLLCTLKRVRLRPRSIGGLFIHAGVLLIVTGALVGKIWGEKGFIRIYEGQRVASFKTYKSMLESRTVRDLGFEIRLNDFKLELYPPRLFIKYRHTQQVEDFDIVEGKKYKLGWGGYRIRIDKYFPEYFLQEVVFSRSEKCPQGVQYAGPAVQLDITTPKHVGPIKQWLFAELPERSKLTIHDELTICYRLCPTAKDLEKEQSLPEDISESLTIIIQDQNLRWRIPIQLGKKVSIGSGYKVQIQRYTPDFKMRDKPTYQRPTNPALHVLISGPKGDEQRWVFSRFPGYEPMHRFKYTNVRLRYHRPAQDLIKIIEAPDGAKVLIHIKDGTNTSVSELKVGSKLTFSSGYGFKVVKFIPDAVIQRIEGTKSEEPLNPVVKLNLEGPLGTEHLSIGSCDPVISNDGNLYLYLWQDPNAVKDFKSNLSIIENGKEVLTKTIEVNHPLSWKGYTFYQSSYDRDRLDWTGLLVVNDPGIGVVYFGLWLLGIGLICVGFVNPLLKRSR
jgi:hypothetical protein